MVERLRDFNSPHKALVIISTSEIESRNEKVMKMIMRRDCPLISKNKAKFKELLSSFGDKDYEKMEIEELDIYGEIFKLSDSFFEDQREILLAYVIDNFLNEIQQEKIKGFDFNNEEKYPYFEELNMRDPVIDFLFKLRHPFLLDREARISYGIHHYVYEED